MFCGNCGTQVNDNARFCGKCGAAQMASVQRAAPPVQPQYRAAVSPLPPPAASKNTVLITLAAVVAAVIMIAVVITGIWILRHRRSAAQTAQASNIQKSGATPLSGTASGISGRTQNVDSWYTGVMTKGVTRLNIRLYIGEIENDKALECFYVYTKYNEPIYLRGGFIDGVLCLKEVDQPKEAVFIFNNFTGGDDTLTGEWINPFNETDRYTFTLTRADNGY